MKDTRKGVRRMIDADTVSDYPEHLGDNYDDPWPPTKEEARAVLLGFAVSILWRATEVAAGILAILLFVMYLTGHL